MIENMTICNLSPATQQSYLYAVAKFSRHSNRSPDRLGLEEVRAYQLHLIARQRSWSHINQTVCALRFFYGVTLGRSDAHEQIVAAPEPQRLPEILSGEEIVRFLEAVPGLRNRVALTTAYGAGLRVGEVVRLQPAAIDSSRMLIRIAQGKGAKDRYVMLSPQLLQILRTYWRLARPGKWLFPGHDPAEPVSIATLQEACRQAARQAEHEQAGHRPYPAAQLRHASARGWHRHPYHPGAARPRPAVDHGTLHAGRHPSDLRHRQPAGSPEHRGDAAQLIGPPHATRA